MMKNAPNAPANAGVTLPEAEDIIRRQRKDKGKPPSCRPRAIDLARNNETIIRQLRDAGYKQEDAVLLLLDLGHEGHQPDTLRKAIASVLGPWSNPVDHTAEAIAAPDADDNPSNAELAEHAPGAVQVRYDNTVDEGDVT